MNNILKISLIVIFFLIAFTFVIEDINPSVNQNIIPKKNTIIDNFSDYTISKIGNLGQMFPKRSKGLSVKYPVTKPKRADKDEIEDIQEIDPDVITYIRL